MFTNLIFLILVLLLVSLAGELDPHIWSTPPSIAFFIGMLSYFLILGVIYIQRKAFKKSYQNTLQIIAALELIAFFVLFHFILGAHRVLVEIPQFNNMQTPIALFSLILYLAGITLASSLRQLRLILPFTFPFLLFTFLLDLISLTPGNAFQKLFTDEHENVFGTLLLFLFSLAFMGLMLIFLPPIIIRVWKCRPMQDSPLKQRLDFLCQKAHFKHGGILDWTILNNSLTAGIVGVLPSMRYVMFTKRIQKQLTPESLEAILSHEIGHSYHRHLLIYPCILFGMVICTGLFSLLFSGPIDLAFANLQEIYPSEVWGWVYPLTIFIPYAVIIAVYFRYVFGYFSRLFERQADLHGFMLGLPPEHMVRALDDVAIATGFTHMVPNWHHHSIQDRMDFLRSAIKNPQVIEDHHKLVRKSIVIYFILLSIGCLLVFSPLLSHYFVFGEITNLVSWLSQKFMDL